MAEALYQDSSVVETHSSDVMYIVKFGGSFKYTIPGFSVITVQLRHAKAQKISGEGDVKLFDVFFNEETAIEMHPPTCVEVIESCFVEAEEFAAQIKLPEIQLVNDAVLVVWKYKLIQNESETEQEGKVVDDDNSVSESTADSNDSEKEDLTSSNPCVPHTIVFKCIGAARDTQSQVYLQTARDRMLSGYTVPVRMRPEPTNIVDSRAIVFECELDGKWNKIGYVVSDILDEVHAAISSNLIISVKFKCIKYVTHWTRSGPGYFAGISITKKMDHGIAE